MVGEEGFEPTQPMATDLQSVVTLQLHRSPTLILNAIEILVKSLFDGSTP